MESYENKTMQLLGAETPKELYEKVDFMISVLSEISDAKGRYDTDKYVHAVNTIYDMQTLANNAIIKLTAKTWIYEKN